MIKNIFLILPHQLYDIKYLDKNYQYILWEHPQYFTKYNFNKKKLILHRASMKYYYDYLKQKDFNITYINFNENPKLEIYSLFDPIDKLELDGQYTIIKSPNFLLDKESCKKYQDKLKTKSVIFTNFYMWSKKELNIFPKLKSMDIFNRQKFKKDIDIPNIPSIGTLDKFYIDNAIQYVDKYFPNNCGNSNNFFYPITHKTAYDWLIQFLNNRINLFGPYQDFVAKENKFMFHSVLSSSLNIGLINPIEIINELKKIEISDNNINSFEGYLRQLFWREYQRYTFIYYDFTKYNFFENNKMLSKEWYTGELNIPPIDDLIKSGFDTGYIHHIGRLMYIGNYMNLQGIRPMEGFRWFMEFAIDSYEWVMYQNVLEMVFFVSGGLTMRRPYTTSSNYIINMSNYSKGEWSIKWNIAYDSFLKKHKDKLWKFRYHYPGLKKID